MSGQIFAHPDHEYTWVKNVILDRVMPALSPEGWKVLCVALRHAWGEDAEERLDLLEFMRKSGITDTQVAQRALEECLAAGYLLCRTEPAQEQARDTYVLNTAFEFDPAASQATAEWPALTPEQEQAFEALLAFGQEMEASPAAEQVRAAVKGNPLDAVLAWIETGREMTHLPTADRFKTVVARLNEQVPPLLVPAFEAAQEGDKGGKGATTDGRDPAALWQATLDHLRPQLKKSQFKWLKPTQGIQLSGGALTVAVPTRRSKEWLEGGVLADTIQQALNAIVGQATELVFVVE